MKKIVIKVNSNESNEKIEKYLRSFLRDNFWDYKSVQLTIEDE